MGFVFRKRKKLGKGLTLNVYKSGPSVSKKAGPFTLSSRGNLSIRLSLSEGLCKTSSQLIETTRKNTR
ncbi:DUF4236 domain-containing protein [Glutamicibacter sp. V16R2B1]|uniref:DUF4236 domain-containing protein n=1 Tax=Glutamicibacter sp. V16R2B1 TaxID=2036207 RepID=UPI0010FEEB24|nr:DUF4236 domain-containing protein [Glutamicibacter sp. V16R2B1]TLK57042.1 DUF4236 domain-containing protein [Glutamicibacter sp. V16R2B1]